MLNLLYFDSHSTMYLLKPSDVVIKDAVDSEFTFHHVSIKTVVNFLFVVVII